ncbi:MAG: PQQ-binding-like beta-propeller repeat protein [bacterium]
MRCTAILMLLMLMASMVVRCGDDDAGAPAYRVPLAQESPWPKFRRNAAQTGLSTVTPSLTGGALWEFQTGKGIFSSPVIGGDGTVYIGSADRYFYAINPDGTEKWRHLTGEIVDSSALLDDQGRVFFGSGDGLLYALDAETGEALWTFQADDPSVNQAFIRWFEGNVAMGPDGTLYVPNDNFFVYAIDRETGDVVWRFQMMDQTWSSPAVDPDTGTLYIGNNNLLALMGLGDNTYAIDAVGDEVWAGMSLGSVAASPMLVEGRVVVGSFDGVLRAYSRADGDELWSFPTRDHLYASPGLLPNGTIVQPSADGTIYAVDAATGTLRWAFDALEPIRSSPAVDADGNIYVGSGEGRLFVLCSDGTLRWAMRLIDDRRNDLNSSPALGVDAIYIAGESGTVFSVPYDYCLRDVAAQDERCWVGPGEDLPADGAHLFFTTRFGAPLAAPPAEVHGNQLLAFSLFVRDGGDTTLAVIDSDSVEVTIDPTALLEVGVSGERRFLTVAPVDRYGADGNGEVTITVTGEYLVDLEREGLRFFGGTTGGEFSETFTFTVLEGASGVMPLPVPTAPGDDAGVWELSRLAAPLPTILPSYNQIGFDSLHFLVGLVEETAGGAIGWVVGARLAEGENRTEVDPGSRALFPVEISYDSGLLTMLNANGFTLEVMNATIPMDTFRVAASLDAAGGAPDSAGLLVTTICSDIQMYGAFLNALGFCNPVSDALTAFGAAELQPHAGGVQSAPAGLGTVVFTAAADSVTATVTGSSLLRAAHSYGLLLIDLSTGRPVTLDYGLDTAREEDGNGNLSSVSVSFDRADVPDDVRIYLLVDTYPAATGTLAIP